jgi:hypothetical protein
MPKKTKKEKIIADLRRRLQDQPTQLPKQPAVSDISYRLPPKKQVAKVETTDDTAQLLLIKKDLVKTLILTVLAIGIEFVLFATTKNKLF